MDENKWIVKNKGTLCVNCGLLFVYSIRVAVEKVVTGSNSVVFHQSLLVHSLVASVWQRSDSKLTFRRQYFPAGRTASARNGDYPRTRCWRTHHDWGHGTPPWPNLWSRRVPHWNRYWQRRHIRAHDHHQNHRQRPTTGTKTNTNRGHRKNCIPRSDDTSKEPKS